MAALTADEMVVLAECRSHTIRPCAAAQRLSKRGYVVIGSGRFGAYAEITTKGREKLDKDVRSGYVVAKGYPACSPPHVKKAATKQFPEASAGLAKPSTSCGDLAPRSRRKAAQAEATPDIAATASISPPEAPLDVGGAFNAVKVKQGKHVIYYPISMWSTIKDNKEQAVADKKFYRLYKE